LDYVASINSGSGLCGHNDWHLPNVNELESLVNAGQSDSTGWLNTQGFINVQAEYYWSSTSNSQDATGAWAVLMDRDVVTIFGKTINSCGVWPVRSGQVGTIQLPKTGQTKCYYSSGTERTCAGTGQDGEIQAGAAWPDPRFTISGNCVTDKLTRLMWAKNGDLPNSQMDWQGALDYVAVLNSGSGLCGYNNWSLPNQKELRSLIDYSQYAPALPLNQPFYNIHSSGDWSSTSFAYSKSYAYIVVMSDGSMTSKMKGLYSDERYVWPVRSVIFPPFPTTTTGSATNVTQHLATLNGTVNPNGLFTTYYFQWGTTTSYGNTTAGQSAGSNWSDVTVSANLTGLTSNATYHFRLVATNHVGTTYGSDMTFTTSSSIPTVITSAASGVTNTSATLNGTLNPKGLSTTYCFE
jgi:hypothetical protein